MPRKYSKHTLNSPRRAPRFNPHQEMLEHLPTRCEPVRGREDKPGHWTYYVSCDPRGLAPYLPHIVRHFQRGFRGAIVARAGLVLEAPSVVVLGLQEGDTFQHAMEWASTNPIDEIAREHGKAPVLPLKVQEKAQSRFGEAVATLEALAEQKLAAEQELELATAELIVAQGVESVCIEGDYYDVSYSREKVYLKRRDPRFLRAVGETAEPPKRKRRPAAAAKKRKRAA